MTKKVTEKDFQTLAEEMSAVAESIMEDNPAVAEIKCSIVPNPKSSFSGSVGFTLQRGDYDEDSDNEGEEDEGGDSFETLDKALADSKTWKKFKAEYPGFISAVADARTCGKDRVSVDVDKLSDLVKEFMELARG